MISFGMSEEQEMVQDAMREFAADAIRPIARDGDEAAEVPADFLETAWSLGLTSTQIPEAYGGAGEARSPLTNALVLEELGHGDASLALAMTVPVLAILLIRLGLRGRIDRHRRLARVAWPIWMYVSVTGVAIYFALYHFNPIPA